MALLTCCYSTRCCCCLCYSSWCDVNLLPRFNLCCSSSGSQAEEQVSYDGMVGRIRSHFSSCLHADESRTTVMSSQHSTARQNCMKRQRGFRKYVCNVLDCQQNRNMNILCGLLVCLRWWWRRRRWRQLWVHNDYAASTTTTARPTVEKLKSNKCSPASGILYNGDGALLLRLLLLLLLLVASF